MFRGTWYSFVAKIFITAFLCDLSCLLDNIMLLYIKIFA